MEYRREQANMNAITVKNIEMPAVFSYKDVKPPNAHQLIN
jgi:hypothetical protein